jgi:predicted AAA+ superfamily ATPase
MKREIYKQLLEWKLSVNRKPLILQGARQIGKTWILRHFGECEYKYVAYINCDNEPLAQSLFVDYNIERILLVVESITHVPIVAGETLIIFDEIQEIAKGLSALKYFCENAPEHHVAVAGSLLGLILHPGESFPVGKVDMLQMYPMTYEEFLVAGGEEKMLEILRSQDWVTISALHSKYIDLLRRYYYVGGMPEAVKAFVEQRGLDVVRDIQNNILQAYSYDISKHAPQQMVQRINQVLQSIPSQLVKENKKFIYGAVRKGARASDFELAIQWLIDAGVVVRVSRVSKPEVPLNFYQDFNAFKLFLLDCGLFGAMNNTLPEQVMASDSVFKEYKGAFTELYVLQQMRAIKNKPIYYFSSDGDSDLEVDFVVQHLGKALPIEVKAEENLRAKSLKMTAEKYKIPMSVRVSMSAYRQELWLTNVPLYGIKSFLEK